MNRDALIARKHEVRVELERRRRRLEQAHKTADSWWNRRRIKRLEVEIEQLMAEEYRLRLAIDRA